MIVEEQNRISGAASAGRGPHLQDRTRAKQKVPRCRNLHSSATSSTSFTVSTPRVRNMGSTWDQLWQTRPQLGPNLDPTWTHLALFGSNRWEITGPIWNPENTRFHWCFPRFCVLWHRWRFVLTTIPHVVPLLGPTWCEAIAKGPPKLHYAEHDLDLHVHHMASSSAHLGQTLGPTSAQHNSNLGASWVQHSATWAQALFADSMRHADNVLFDCYFQRFLASVGVPAMPCSHVFPTLGLSWAQLRRQLPPCRTQLRRLSLTCGPSWLEPSGKCSVQVTPKLGPSRLVFGPT